jgi:hypothetical protein
MMKTATTRRRTKLRSSQSALERWKPSPPIVVMALGLVLGIAFGMRGRLFDQSASIQEHYLLLASDLYAEGAPIISVRDRLIGLGYANPSVAVVGVADQLSTSSDKVKQQEGDQLHQFAAALAAGTDQPAVTAIASPVPTALPEATSTAAAFSIAEVAPVVPTPIPTLAALESPTPEADAAAPDLNSTPALPPAATPVPAPSAPAPTPAGAGTGRSGVIQTENRLPVYLRKSPTSKSTIVTVVPSGSKVDIRGVVAGEAVDPKESHWYKIVFNGKSGYIYSEYVVAGG